MIFAKKSSQAIRNLRRRRGAEDGTRTHDLLITNQLLYHLSHFSVHKLLYNYLAVKSRLYLEEKWKTKKKPSTVE